LEPEIIRGSNILKQKTILVAGATGTSGRYITSSLSESGYKIRAFVRDKKKAQSILPEEVELVEGDLRQISDVENAMQGVSGLYISLGIGENQTEKYWTLLKEGLKNLLVIARSNDIEHIIGHFMIGARPDKQLRNSWWGYDLQAKAVQLLENSRIPYTLFFCSPFMENFETRFRKGNNIRILTDNKFPIYWTSARQVGQLAAKAFFHKEFWGHSFSVQGIEALNLQVAAEIFVTCYKKASLTLQNTDSNLVKLFVRFRPGMDVESQWMEAISKDPEEYESDNTWQEFGISPLRFSEFAKAPDPDLIG